MIEKRTPVRILVRAPNWIGDQVLAYPFYHLLRRAYPRARISVACVPWVEAVQFRNLIDEVLVLPRVLRPGWLGRIEALEEAGRLLKRAGPWDLGISLPNSFSAAWQLFRSGARSRRGYDVDGRGLLLNAKTPWAVGAELHRAEAYVKLLPEAGADAARVMEFWGVPPENDLDPGVPGVVSRFDWQNAWPGVEQVEPPASEYWVLAPGTTAESRRWPMERFASLARSLAEETGAVGVVVGGPAEAPLADQLCGDRSLRLIDRTARGPVSGLARLFAGAKFSVCNDSGLAHIAALCGSPVAIVWGGGDPKRTRPLGPGRVRMVFNPIECWPCERNQCVRPGAGAGAGVAKVGCLAGIQPEAILKEIGNALRP
ncbi:MAG: glycosyltransferase family 9 protein [Oligoflexia bacterium]|nr:glycosyltransferase family 9 protein [Oligoflexia bacterium]